MEIRSVVDGERCSAFRPTDAVRNRRVDRVSVAERVVEAEVVEQSKPVNVQGRSVHEIVLFATHTLVRDEVGPEKPAGERTDIKIEIVDLILTRRVSKDVESYEPERGVMFVAVDADVNAFHEAVVDRREKLRLNPCGGVRPHASAQQVNPADNSIEVGDGRGFRAGAKEIYVERGAGKNRLRNRRRVDDGRGGRKSRAPERGRHGCAADNDGCADELTSCERTLPEMRMSLIALRHWDHEVARNVHRCPPLSLPT